jgi:glycosyltransferase involved in cell wall biosynthesis
LLNHPIISIITPLHNKEKYIQSTIDSVCHQTLPTWELWVIDNQSTDRSQEVVKSYQDPRVHLISLETSTGGPGFPRNFGLTQAQGDWVLFLDADDLIEANHLENLIFTAQLNPKASIIVGKWQEYPDHNPKQITVMKPLGYDQDSTALASSIAFAPWACHAALVRREILQSPYLWVEELDPYLSEDTAFWFRLLTRYTVAYSEHNGALYRRLNDGRDQYQDIDRWFRGLHIVIQNNLSFLREQQISLTSDHCEALMRCYSNLYVLAQGQGKKWVAEECLTLAQYWLKKCKNLNGLKTFPLMLRYLMGLPLFLAFQQQRHQLPNP